MDDLPTTGWQPIETAPINQSVLIWLPRWGYYGPGIYRAIQVDMGAERRWRTTAWACGRDLSPDDWPEFWMPLPDPPESMDEYYERVVRHDR